MVPKLFINYYEKVIPQMVLVSDYLTFKNLIKSYSYLAGAKIAVLADLRNLLENLMCAGGVTKEQLGKIDPRQ